MHEASQFEPTKTNVTYLLELYGLEIVDFKLPKSGIENCTIIVTTTDGKYVVRIYRRDYKSDTDVLREVDFTQYLYKHGVPVVATLPNKNGAYISHLEVNGRTWQAILMAYADGEHAEFYSDTLISELAQVQARMHTLSTSYASYQGLDENKILKEEYFIKLIQNRPQLDDQIQSFIDRAEKYQVVLPAMLPKGLCHLDFDNGNVLSKFGKVTAVLDFDDLAIAPFVMCLAYTLWDVLFTVGPRGATTYLDRYTDYIKLSSLEKHFLLKIVLFRHYVTGCLKIANDGMDDEILKHYIDIENKLLNPQISHF